jgi:hypothetical protein
VIPLLKLMLGVSTLFSTALLTILAASIDADSDQAATFAEFLASLFNALSLNIAGPVNLQGMFLPLLFATFTFLGGSFIAAVRETQLFSSMCNIFFREVAAD